MQVNDYFVGLAAAGLLLFGVGITLFIHQVWFGTHKHKRRKKKEEERQEIGDENP